MRIYQLHYLFHLLDLPQQCEGSICPYCESNDLHSYKLSIACNKCHAVFTLKFTTSFTPLSNLIP